MKSRGNEIKSSGNGHALWPMLNGKEMANKKNNVMNENNQRMMGEQTKCKEDVFPCPFNAYFSFPKKNKIITFAANIFME